MENVEQAVNQWVNKRLIGVRTVLGLIGLALIVVGLAKMFGTNLVNIPGEYWQIMLAGFCLKSA